MINVENYCLNLIKLKEEDEKIQEYVIRTHSEMIYSYRDYLTGAVNLEKIVMVYYNTLYYNGYLIDIRDLKLEKILE